MNNEKFEVVCSQPACDLYVVEFISTRTERLCRALAYKDEYGSYRFLTFDTRIIGDFIARNYRNS